jgi:Sulfatase-modifying factor enzyme 1/TIR domain
MEARMSTRNVGRLRFMEYPMPMFYFIDPSSQTASCHAIKHSPHFESVAGSVRIWDNTNTGVHRHPEIRWYKNIKHGIRERAGRDQGRRQAGKEWSMIVRSPTASPKETRVRETLKLARTEAFPIQNTALRPSSAYSAPDANVKMNGQIFISYRRDDTSAWAGRLSDRLNEHFSSNQIFIDVDSVRPGEDFVNKIKETVGSCDVLIAVIGAHWVTSSDREGRRRLKIAEDNVRLEISTALKRGILVIPVLIDGATMPEPGELPDDLKDLVHRNALKVSHDHFRPDSDRLASAVALALRESASEKKKRVKKAEDQRVREERQGWKPEPSGSLPGPMSGRAETVEAPMHSQPIPKSVFKKWQLILIACFGAVLIPGASLLLYFNPHFLKATSELKSKPAQPQTTPFAVEATPVPSISGATPTKEALGLAALQAATKDHPWVNSLGMKFVPVAGIQVLFCTWDTRVADFEKFTENTGHNAMGGMVTFDKGYWQNLGNTWKEPGFAQTPSHPVVGIDWNDAQAFCKWLTTYETRLGILPPGRVYRLPTDQEWSGAVGLKYEVGKTPDQKSLGIRLFPWDIPERKETNWPPPEGSGNYAGEGDNLGNWIIRYKDGFARTSPVGSFSVNQFGLYDMGGNVWQWCEDLFGTMHILRGASWVAYEQSVIFASYRSFAAPDRRQGDIGFRCAIAAVPSK